MQFGFVLGCLLQASAYKIFRGMTEDSSKPKKGSTARLLGVRADGDSPDVEADPVTPKNSKSKWQGMSTAQAVRATYLNIAVLRSGVAAARILCGKWIP